MATKKKNKFNNPNFLILQSKVTGPKDQMKVLEASNGYH